MPSPSIALPSRLADVDTYDDCTDQPCCSQGGNCIDLFKDAICICSEGWDGAHARTAPAPDHPTGLRAGPPGARVLLDHSI